MEEEDSSAINLQAQKGERGRPEYCPWKLSYKTSYAYASYASYVS